MNLVRIAARVATGISAEEVLKSLSPKAVARLTGIVHNDESPGPEYMDDPVWYELEKAGLFDSDYSYEGPEDGGWVGGTWLNDLGKAVAALLPPPPEV